MKNTVFKATCPLCKRAYKFTLSYREDKKSNCFLTCPVRECLGATLRQKFIRHSDKLEGHDWTSKVFLHDWIKSIPA